MKDERVVTSAALFYVIYMGNLHNSMAIDTDLCFTAT